MGLYIYIVPQLDIKLGTFSKNSFPIWDHASVRYPGLLHECRASNFLCYLKKIISSEITAFEPGTLASLLVEHVGNVTVYF